jgi:hypothetical protein
MRLHHDFMGCFSQRGLLHLYEPIPATFRGRVSHVFELCNSQVHRSKFSFEQLVEKTRHCKCTDPRDRVYAILSLRRHWVSHQAGTIEPDYTRSFQDIYEDMLRHEVENLQTLRLLRHRELREANQNMLTWVPDLSSPRIQTALRFVQSAGDSSIDASFTGKGELRVTGLPVATIKYVDVVQLDENGAFADIFKEVQRLAFNVDSGASFMTTGSYLETFCRTFCANIFSDRFYPSQKYVSDFQQSTKALHEISNSDIGSLNPFPAGWQSFLRMVMRCIPGRSFFTTNSGHPGLAAKGARPYDLICILFGCNSAMILRPTRNDQYQVVGEAYCDGFMSGEGILGPLPPNLQLGVRFREDLNSYVSAFRERNTGKVLEEDPRLGPLPMGWRKTKMVDYPLEEWFIKDETVEDPTTYDPRLSPEALREKGVDLKVSELI